MTTKPTPEQANKLLKALLADRLENYGYDWKDFRRLKVQRSRARAGVRTYLGIPTALAWNKAPLAHRIDWDTCSYTVGQSSNEEITNLLRQLVNPEAKWVS